MATARVWLSEDEKEKVQQAASRSGKTVSNYIRVMIGLPSILAGRKPTHGRYRNWRRGNSSEKK